MKQTKTYTITLEENETGYGISRNNEGFSAIELLGVLQLTILDIKEQMAGKIKPNVITRNVIKEG